MFVFLFYSEVQGIRSGICPQDLLTNEDSYELLVVRCERARSEARVTSLRQQLTDVTSRRGVFAPARGEPACGRGTAARGHHLHRVLVSFFGFVFNLFARTPRTPMVRKKKDKGRQYFFIDYFRPATNLFFNHLFLYPFFLRLVEEENVVNFFL